VSSPDGVRRLRVVAPAKVNLGLRITGVRADGTHELDSVFAPLDFGDEVAIEVAPAVEASVELALEAETPLAAEVPAGRSNLAAQAAERFLERGGLACAVRIHLTKRIPAAAGLGGGSSDAGAVVRALADCFPEALAPPALEELALGLGADVPFFLEPRPARVGGIGERIEPLSPLPVLALLLVNPGIALATGDVYRAYDALAAGRSGPASVTIGERLEALLREHRVGPRYRGPWGPAFAQSLDDLLANDLEDAAVRLCPPVARLRARLQAAGARAVGLSGSGPTLFGVFEDPAAAVQGSARAGFEAPVWARVATTRESR
jgi:4-diphosphocytidyl-2-C-methyl-D-erythritol kinase